MRTFFKKVKLIFSNATILKRIGITLILLFVFKAGTYLTIPLIDTTAIAGTFKNNDFLSILNTFSGGGLGNFSVLALGISPYITASIVVQLLQLVIPSLKELGEQGESGKEKINRITRYSSAVLAMIQAFVLIFGLSSSASNIFEIEAVQYSGLYWLFYIYLALVITAGSCFTIWLADLITKYGIGNGSSILIAAGIVTSIPNMFITLNSKYWTDPTAGGIVCSIVIIILYLAIIFGIVFLEGTYRKIPVQYANRQGRSDSNIPIKLNTSSVIPVIFASTLLSLPTTIIGLLGLSTSTSTVAYWFNQVCSNSQPIGGILYVFLIYVFSVFYAFMTIDPTKVAENLQKSNAFIPSVRPGEETKNYVSRVLFKTTLIGATYLAILAVIPIITTAAFGFTSTEAQSITIGGTSLLIVVGVAVETMKQLETDATEETYSGFIE